LKHLTIDTVQPGINICFQFENPFSKLLRMGFLFCEGFACAKER